LGGARAYGVRRLATSLCARAVLEDVLDQLADQYGVEDIATAASPVRLTGQAPQT